MKTRITYQNAEQDIATRKGFEAVYNQFWRKVFNISFHHTADRHVSEELVQEIFKSLWERRETLKIEGSIENYLSRAARLKVAEHFRNQAIRARNLQDAIQDHPLAENTTQQMLDLHFLDERITALVDQLPSHCRQVYVMSRREGLSNTQIASSMSISEKTVENQIGRALSYLRKRLANLLK